MLDLFNQALECLKKMQSLKFAHFTLSSQIKSLCVSTKPAFILLDHVLHGQSFFKFTSCLSYTDTGSVVKCNIFIYCYE